MSIRRWRPKKERKIVFFHYIRLIGHRLPSNVEEKQWWIHHSDHNLENSLSFQVWIVEKTTANAIKQVNKLKRVKTTFILHTNKECNKCHLNSNVEKICSRPALNFRIHIMCYYCTTVSAICTHVYTNMNTYRLV